MSLNLISEQVSKNPGTVVITVIVITCLMIAQLALNPQDGTISQSSFLPENEVISSKHFYKFSIFFALLLEIKTFISFKRFLVKT